MLVKHILIIVIYYMHIAFKCLLTSMYIAITCINYKQNIFVANTTEQYQYTLIVQSRCMVEKSTVTHGSSVDQLFNE